MNPDNIDPHAIGAQLVDHAASPGAFSARGILDDLFPYIFDASKRMSTHAISKWLLETHKVKLSATAIANALRKPQKYWVRLAQKAEGTAQRISIFTGIPVIELLFADAALQKQISDLSWNPKQGRRTTGERMLFQLAAVSFDSDWLFYSKEVRAECIPFLKCLKDEKGRK